MMENIKDKTQSLIAEVVSFVQVTPWKSLHKARLERLSDLADMPCELAIAGKVKAGKSSFLNALLGVDLAMVGTTETTATINFFKYGIPDDPEKPVMVYWNDGRSPEPQTKEFLDSLQGYKKEVLDKAEKIDHLEYYLPNPILRKITLIDTPGVGSVEDTHEQRVTDYFNPQRVEALRKAHEKQSDSLTETADAVVYISTPVPERGAQEFFADYMPKISAINALGVMTQIDKEEGNTTEVISRMAKTLADAYRKELCTVIPVSAGVYHAVKKLGIDGLTDLREKIRRIPENKFKSYLNGSNIFLQKDGLYNRGLEDCGLPYSVRLEMVGFMPWRVFFTIAVALYRMPLDEAEQYLIEYSGMEKVKELLHQQFFNRSECIRCSKILTEVKQILFSMKNSSLSELRSQAKSRNDYLCVINQAEGRFNSGLLASLRHFIENNIPELEICDRYEKQLDSLLKKADTLQETMQGVEKSSEGLLLLDMLSNRLHDQKEVEELETLFGKYPDRKLEGDKTYFIARQRSWLARQHRMQNDKELSKLLSLVCATYGKLLKEIKD